MLSCSSVSGRSCEAQLQSIIALAPHRRMAMFTAWIKESARQAVLRANGSMGYSNMRVAAYTSYYNRPENLAESVLLCGETASLAPPALSACPFVQAIAVIQVRSPPLWRALLLGHS